MSPVDDAIHTPGELEETILINSSRAANFVALLRHDSAIRSTVPELVEAYEKFAAEDSRGTRLANLSAASHPSEDIALVGSSSPERLSNVLYPKYVAAAVSSSKEPPPRPPSRSVFLAQKIAIRGVRYASADVFERDSNVIFHRAEPGGEPQTIAGQIHKIFTAPSPMSSDPNAVTAFVEILPYSPLPAASSEEALTLDRVCRSFSPVGGYLSSSRKQESCVIHAADIVCHFAKLSLDEVLPDDDVMHVLQLDRVSLFVPDVTYLSDSLDQLHEEGIYTEGENIQ